MKGCIMLRMILAAAGFVLVIRGGTVAEAGSPARYVMVATNTYLVNLPINMGSNTLTIGSGGIDFGTSNPTNTHTHAFTNQVVFLAGILVDTIGSITNTPNIDLENGLLKDDNGLRVDWRNHILHFDWQVYGNMTSSNMNIAHGAIQTIDTGSATQLVWIVSGVTNVIDADASTP